jgi:hypothetical protein
MENSTRVAELILENPESEDTCCVHCEHTASPSAEGRTRPQRATAMPSYRIQRCLATLGWSERELARRTGRHQTTVRRWTDGTSPIDADVAAWLETMERFYRAHPAPRLAPMLRPATAKRDHHQNRAQGAGNAQRAHAAIT